MASQEHSLDDQSLSFGWRSASLVRAQETSTFHIRLCPLILLYPDLYVLNNSPHALTNTLV